MALLLVAGGAAPVEAAPFTYSITLTGDVTGSGTISLPTDAGAGAAGVDLSLAVSMFGNAATFTGADIADIAWAGADPALPDLDVLTLSLFSLDASTALTLLLNDSGGGLGDATCADPVVGTRCGGDTVAVGETAWAYTFTADGGEGGSGGGGGAVPGAPALVSILAGLAGLTVRRRMPSSRTSAPSRREVHEVNAAP